MFPSSGMAASLKAAVDILGFKLEPRGLYLVLSDHEGNAKRLGTANAHLKTIQTYWFLPRPRFQMRSTTTVF